MTRSLLHKVPVRARKGHSRAERPICVEVVNVEREGEVYCPPRS